MPLSEYFKVSIDYLLTGKEHTPSNVVSGSVNGSAFIQGTNSGYVVVHNGDDTRALSDEAVELLRIFELLDVKGRHKLLESAFLLEKKMENEK